MGINSFQISKVEYLSNHLLDNTQISNLSLGDKANSRQILEMKMTFNVILLKLSFLAFICIIVLGFELSFNSLLYLSCFLLMNIAHLIKTCFHLLLLNLYGKLLIISNFSFVLTLCALLDCKSLSQDMFHRAEESYIKCIVH